MDRLSCLSPATSPNASSELEQARPQTSGEEELQLQLALAMSREAAEQVPARRYRLEHLCICLFVSECLCPTHLLVRKPTQLLFVFCRLTGLCALLVP